ncbi:uncharacterized protein L201_007332 [Kwoniella dendrophila CBS 6074]|uniref:Uncharacterized protein n=1 Tax=Kwoniella dendrophila CBS 6074 TaxID=1295534 RepID=A0AAX4K6E2_9TREE
MTSLARPINFPSSRPSYSRSNSDSPNSSPKSSHVELGTSPQQHPCPHLSQLVQSVVKAYWGQGQNQSIRTNDSSRH